MNKKKIAIFIISLYGGGAERVVSILLHHLKDDFDIHLVLLNNLVEYSIPTGQKIHILDRSSTTNPVANVLKIPALAVRYYRLLKKNNIQLSFSFLNRPNFIAGCLRYLGWKGHIIISERTFTSSLYTNKTLGGRIGRFLVKKLYNKA